MKLLHDFLIIVVPLAYLILMFGLFPLGIFALFLETKNRRRFIRDVIEKICNKIHLNSDDIERIAKARGIKDGAAAAMLRKICADARDPVLHEKLSSLCVTMEVITPYSDFPGDVRDSLLRMREFLVAKGCDNDQRLMEPIVTNLSAHVDLKNDYLRSKKVAIFMNFIGFVSFVFGMWGIYVSINSPTINQIKEVVESAVVNRSLNLPMEK
ncbi:hypothetical protein NHB13_10180 [Delftia tsuruhatensis]|uniref:hypothetical protein n=1 Tax=Delftia tsuruhatensis TaxID=180282 RepID=UPI002090EC3F|nr:hypothetical protein [Delftia tsuruhatensis]MCO5336970.1 hypothetical protein [Delftia tsuruhatensis]